MIQLTDMSTGILNCGPPNWTPNLYTQLHPPISLRDPLYIHQNISPQDSSVEDAEERQGESPSFGNRTLQCIPRVAYVPRKGGLYQIRGIFTFAKVQRIL